MLTSCLPQYTAYSPDLSRGVLEDGLGHSVPAARHERPLYPESREAYRICSSATTRPAPTNSSISRPTASLPPTRRSGCVAGPPSRRVQRACSVDPGTRRRTDALRVVRRRPLLGRSDPCAGSDQLLRVRLYRGRKGRLWGPNFNRVGLVDRAVSNDGSRVFFNADGNLYLRTGDTTREVDVSQGPGPSGGGDFMTASKTATRFSSLIRTSSPLAPARTAKISTATKSARANSPTHPGRHRLPRGRCARSSRGKR